MGRAVRLVGQPVPGERQSDRLGYMTKRWKPNLTVAAIVARPLRGMSVVDPGTQFLLVEEETTEGLRLNNPAGHLECGESPLDAVVREVLEETTCAFRPEFLVGVYMSRYVRPHREQDVTYVRLAFSGVLGEEDPALSLDEGIVRTVWMTLEELHASRDRHRSPLVLRGVSDLLAGQRLPLSALWVDPTVQVPEVRD